MVLIDTNILIDVISSDSSFKDSSTRFLEEIAENHEFAINQIIYSEASIAFARIEDLEEALAATFFRRLDLPWESCFLAGKAFLTYKRRGGTKRSPLPDFFIGAHAAVAKLPLATRDAARYRTYFPTLTVLTPG